MAESENESSVGEEDEEGFSLSSYRTGTHDEEKGGEDERTNKNTPTSSSPNKPNDKRRFYFNQESVKFQESIRGSGQSSSQQTKMIVRDINIDPKARTIAVSSL